MELNFLEFLLWIPSIILILTIILLPFFVVRTLTVSINNKFTRLISTFSLTLIASFVLTFLLVYYSVEFSNDLIVTKYGFNFNGMNEEEYYKNVSSENLIRLKAIRNSQMGIGWPLKALFAFVLFTLPINLIVSIVYGIKRK